MNQLTDLSTIQERFGKAIMSGELDEFDDLVAENFVDHDPAPNQEPGAEGLKTFFRALRTALPDLQVVPVTALQIDDKMAMAYTIEGTQTGPLMGIPATGKRISIRGMQISRFENGKMVERWGSSDELGMLKQIGAGSIPVG